VRDLAAWDEPLPRPPVGAVRGCTYGEVIAQALIRAPRSRAPLLEALQALHLCEDLGDGDPIAWERGLVDGV